MPDVLGPEWNRRRWALWAPFYDHMISFEAQRRRSIELAALRAGERVLIAGCGTGLDIPMLPAGVQVCGCDIAAPMLRRAAARGGAMAVMDVTALGYAGGVFDAVLLHLILAVVSRPEACLREVRRVLRPGGRVMVFDKILPPGREPSVARRLANRVARVVATDINLRLWEHAAAAGFRIEHDEEALLSGVFRVARLRVAE